MINKLPEALPQGSEIILLEKAGGDFELDGIEFKDVPSHLRIRIKTSLGKGSLIYSELWLPDDFCGIFVGTGNGGIAGKIAYHSLAEYVRQGYAVANTDMGTSEGELAGIANPDMWEDFGRRSTHEMTAIAKALIRKYYGKAADYSYFYGCSTGGEQALSLAQYFPEDYDGIIAGVPANNRTHLHTYFLWNYVHLRPKGRSPLFNEEQIALISDLAAIFFDPAGKKYYVSMPWRGADTVDRFIAYLSEKTDFNDEQLSALRAVYQGPKNPRTGEQIYNGMPIGSEIYGCGIKDCSFGQRPPHYYPFIWTFGKDYDPYSFDFDKDLDLVNGTLAEHLNANRADLNDFKARGSKLLIFSGSADPCVPFPDAYAYYLRLLAGEGSAPSLLDFARYYLAEGKSHGGDGRGVSYLALGKRSLLDVLRAWREGGKAPSALDGVMTKDGKNPESIIVYPLLSDECPKIDIMPTCSSRYLEK